jgi:hypothetical protein
VKGLAEFVMGGRFRALLIAVAGAGSVLFCWISAAVMALVTLRKGAREGAWILLWALLPAGVLLLSYGESSPLSLLLGTMVLALVLRSTVSLPLAVLTAVPVGLATGLLILAFGEQLLEQILQAYSELLAQLEQQLSSGGAAVELLRPTPAQVAGMMAAGNAMLAVLCLLLARYWQAALYHPGGFAREFQALILPPGIATALVAGAAVLTLVGNGMGPWAAVLLVPLTYSGLALVHARVAYRGRGAGWLAAFYLAWLLLDPVKLIVVLFALADSWMRFRQRWSGPSSGEGGDGTDSPE